MATVHPKKASGAGTCCLDCRLESSGGTCGHREPTTCTDFEKMACASAVPHKVMTEDDLHHWPHDDKRRILHAVYRVGDIEKTMKWMQECLGMHILRRRDVPEEKYMNVFMGFGAEDNHFVIELTYNYGITKYDIGAAFGHLGVAVSNVEQSLDNVKKFGYKAPAAPTKDGSDVFAYIEDPDGYKFKFIQRSRSSREPLCQISYRVGDIDRAILFYQDVYGMKLIGRHDYPARKKTTALVAYDLDETRGTVVEFEYNYGITDYPKGNGWAHVAIGTEDVYNTASACELGGGSRVRAPGPLPKLSTKIYAGNDPDGWTTVWVDNKDFARELEPSAFVHQVRCTTDNKKQQL